MATAVSPVKSNNTGTPSRPWLPIAAVAAALAVLYARVLAGLAQDWWNESSLSHGMLIPPLAVYVAWLRRGQILAEPAQTDLRGLWMTAIACLLFLAGKLSAEYFMMRISFVIVLGGLIWTFWGVQRLRALAFPLLLLATMVPLPSLVYNSLSAPLQLLASDLATQLAQALGVSVYRDGNIIQLASTSLGVAEACSGLASLSTLMVASLLLGYLFCNKLITRILLFASAIPLAIAVNILRVSGTALLADYNQEYAMGFYHSFSGWLVFMVGFAFLYLFATLLNLVMERRASR
jgi:exosortase